MHSDRRDPVRLGAVRLEPGTHGSPDEGMCVMEVASMVGDEPFGDRPDCVCPVIAAFLRTSNDRLGYANRQRLLPYAGEVVGTRADRATRRRRRDACLAWGGADLTGRALSRWWRRTGMRLRVAVLVGVRPALNLTEGAGEYAAQIALRRYDVHSALELLASLIEIDNPDEREGAVTDSPRPGDSAGTPAERERLGIYVLARMRWGADDGYVTPGCGPLPDEYCTYEEIDHSSNPAISPDAPVRRTGRTTG